jgi:hypothetical protein
VDAKFVSKMEKAGPAIMVFAAGTMKPQLSNTG